jgi:anionic cell wall polymer biosynthesis LytR-Cps2A-Psr (LCP) family protein
LSNFRKQKVGDGYKILCIKHYNDILNPNIKTNVVYEEKGKFVGLNNSSNSEKKDVEEEEEEEEQVQEEVPKNEEKEEELKTEKSEEDDMFEKLEKLAKLKDKGIITEEEFQEKKKQILGI